MRASPVLPHHDPVRIPGEGREAARARNLKAGVPLHAALRRELDAIAGELGVEPLPAG
jgi:LDH2 family malate/lactate/ureidoglycolate dehydrogenase